MHIQKCAHAYTGQPESWWNNSELMKPSAFLKVIKMANRVISKWYKENSPGGMNLFQVKKNAFCFRTSKILPFIVYSAVPMTALFV